MSNMQEEKEKAWRDHDLCGDVGKFAGINKMSQEDVAKFFYYDGFDAGVKAERERLGKILSEQYFTESMWKELIPDEQEGDR